MLSYHCYENVYYKAGEESDNGHDEQHKVTRPEPESDVPGEMALWARAEVRVSWLATAFNQLDAQCVQYSEPPRHSQHASNCSADTQDQG